MRARTLTSVVWMVTACLVASCGPGVTLEQPAGGSGGAPAGGAGGAGAAPGGSGGAEGGAAGGLPTGPVCELDGFRICGGPLDCQCEYECSNIKDFTDEKGPIGLCETPELVAYTESHPGAFGEPVRDGDVRVEAYPGWGYWGRPAAFGWLYLLNGYAHLARYADYGAFDGTPLPVPSTCPTELNALPVCGGKCGTDCNDVGGPDYVCSGRSKLHPYGVCVRINSYYHQCSPVEPCQDPERSCFSFTVDADNQSLADDHGFCMLHDDCVGLASLLPGGGTCHLSM